MLSDWQLLFSVAAAYVVGRQVLIVWPRQKRAAARKNNPVKKSDAMKFPKIEKPDFYGLKAEEKDPEKFHANVARLQKKLENGEEVPVDAATAFYLMRNIQHHDLIVGETGTINMNVLDAGSVLVVDENKIEEMSRKIMEFKTDDQVHFSKRKRLPEYIRESIPLSCGGVHWVFHDWHAQECGMPGLWFDKHGRPMPDPEQAIEEKKSKDKKQKGSSQNKDFGAIGNIASELSRISEIVTDLRGEQILKSDIMGDEKNDTLTQKQNSVDEIKILETKHPLPDFLVEENDEVHSSASENESQSLKNSVDLKMQHQLFGFDDEIGHDKSDTVETIDDSENAESEEKTIVETAELEDGDDGVALREL
jgi:hypothetical protein